MINKLKLYIAIKYYTIFKLFTNNIIYVYVSIPLDTY